MADFYLNDVFYVVVVDNEICTERKGFEIVERAKVRTDQNIKNTMAFRHGQGIYVTVERGIRHSRAFEVGM